MKINKISAFTMAVIFSMSMAITAQAGDINANESAIIGAASGTFTYNGRSYAAKSEYLGQLQAKLAEDGVDLTADQANELISQMYGAVGAGVTQGYLTPVDGGEPDTEPGIKAEPLDDGETNGRETKGTPDTKKGEQTNSGKDADNGDFSVEGLFAGQGGQEVNGRDISETEPEKGRQDQSGSNKKSKENNKTASENRGRSDSSDQSSMAEDDENKNNKEPSANREDIEEDFNKTEKENNSVVSSFANSKGLLVLLIVILALVILGGIVLTVCKKRKFRGCAVVPEEPYIDIHSHILPGVDDGPPDMDTSLKMISEAYRQGIRTMIATPHYHIDHYHVKADQLEKIYLKTKAEVEKMYPDFRICLGNEVFYSDGIIERLEEKRALTLSNSKYVLIEFRIEESYRCIFEAVLQLVRSGYIPVIAHVERYKNLVNSREHMDEIHKAGAFLQMNAISAKKHLKLFVNGDIDFIATDCHDLQMRMPEIKEAVQQICKVCDPQQIHKILVSNPQCILDNKYI